MACLDSMQRGLFVIFDNDAEVTVGAFRDGGCHRVLNQ